MSFTDPVADLLTRIRNAINARQQKLDVPASKLKMEIARILKEEGYLANFKATEENGQKVLRLYLKYGANNDAAITNLARIVRTLLPVCGAACPAIVAYRVSWPDEQLIRGTLGDIRELVKQAGITRTALILVGWQLGDGQPAELAAPYDQRAVEQATLLQVA